MTGVSTLSRNLIYVCDPKTAGETPCAKQIGENLARRAFRRPATETDVATLLSKQAIRENMQNYCRGIDRLDRELFTSVFHPDATVDYEGMVQCTAA